MDLYFFKKGSLTPMGNTSNIKRRVNLVQNVSKKINCHNVYEGHKHMLVEFLVGFSCYCRHRHPARTGSPLGCDVAP